MIKHGQ